MIRSNPSNPSRRFFARFFGRFAWDPQSIAIRGIRVDVFSPICSVGLFSTQPVEVFCQFFRPACFQPTKRSNPSNPSRRCFAFFSAGLLSAHNEAIRFDVFSPEFSARKSRIDIRMSIIAFRVAPFRAPTDQHWSFVDSEWSFQCCYCCCSVATDTTVAAGIGCSTC